MATHTPGERITELRNTYSIGRDVLVERSGIGTDEMTARIIANLMNHG